MGENTPGKIRIVYASTVNFAALLYRLIAALVFTIAVARKLSVTDFAAYGVILSLSYFLSSIPTLWIYWSARWSLWGRREAGGTGLWLTLATTALLTPLYIGASWLVSEASGLSMSKLLLGITIMYLDSLNRYILGFLNTAKPESTGAARFIYETTRILLGYMLIVEMKQALRGAIAVYDAAYIISIAYGVYILARLGLFTLAFNTGIAKELLRGARVTVFGTLSGMLRYFTRSYISIVTGSDLAVAYYNLGVSTEGPIVNASGASTSALYASLLRESSGNSITLSIRVFLFFTGFLASVYIFLAKPIASLFNPAYLDAWPLIITLAVYGITAGLAGVYSSSIMGLDREDKESFKASWGSLSSWVFRLNFKLLLAAYVISTPLLYLYRSNPLAAAESFALSLLATSIARLALTYRAASRMLPHELPWRELTGLLVGSILSGFYYKLSGATGIVVSSFWKQTPLLLIHIGVGAALFYTVFLVLSPWSRLLIRAVLSRLGLRGHPDDLPDHR